MTRARVILIKGIQLARSILLALNLNLEATFREKFRTFIDKGKLGITDVEGEVLIGRVADVRRRANIAVDDKDAIAVEA